jgi:hypothetical protein
VNWPAHSAFSPSTTGIPVLSMSDNESIITRMTVENIKQSISALAKPQLENLLKTMECSEHILALKTVLFSLDSHAQKIFDEQLALEHAKNQKQREGLEMMLRSLQSGFSGMQS